MYLPTYLGLQHHCQRAIAQSYRTMIDAQSHETHVAEVCGTFAADCDAFGSELERVVERYGERSDREPENLLRHGLSGARTGPIGLLRDLQDLYLLVTLGDITWDMLRQAGHALRDVEMRGMAERGAESSSRQLRWLRTIMEQKAPQLLVVT